MDSPKSTCLLKSLDLKEKLPVGLLVISSHFLLMCRLSWQKLASLLKFTRLN